MYLMDSLRGLGSTRSDYRVRCRPTPRDRGIAGVSQDNGATATISSVLVSASIQARDRLYYGERLTVSFRSFSKNLESHARHHPAKGLTANERRILSRMQTVASETTAGLTWGPRITYGWRPSGS